MPRPIYYEPHCRMNIYLTERFLYAADEPQYDSTFMDEFFDLAVLGEHINVSDYEDQYSARSVKNLARRHVKFLFLDSWCKKYANSQYDQ